MDELQSGDELLLCKYRLKQVNLDNKVTVGLQSGCVESTISMLVWVVFKFFFNLDCRL